jgi:transcriptional regulator with XRE-family HTH domain
VLRLKFLRIASDRRQYEIAELTGIRRPELSRIESGRLNPTPDELARLAKVYGVLPERLLDHITVNDGVESHDSQRERASK